MCRGFAPPKLPRLCGKPTSWLQKSSWETQRLGRQSEAWRGISAFFLFTTDSVSIPPNRWASRETSYQHPERRQCPPQGIYEWLTVATRCCTGRGKVASEPILISSRLGRVWALSQFTYRILELKMKQIMFLKSLQISGDNTSHSYQQASAWKASVAGHS